MTDVLVTVPQSFGLEEWIAEGDPAGEPWSGEEYDFYLGGPRPIIKPGERVYVVYNGAVRGYAPLVRVQRDSGWRFSLVRHGGAVAVTIPEYVRGFQGWRYRWWDRTIEVPFPDWQDSWALPPGVTRPAGAPQPPRERKAEPAPIRCGFGLHTHSWVTGLDPRFERCTGCPAIRLRQ